MLRRAVPTALVIAAALTGCGADAAPTAPGTPGPRAQADGKPLNVGTTQLRLGDATTADDRAGARQLRVGPRKVVPDALERQTGPRDGVGAGASCADRDLLPDATNTGAVPAATLCLLNGQRVDAGLVPLRTSGKLGAAAKEHSQDMVARQYFDHTAKD